MTTAQPLPDPDAVAARLRAHSRRQWRSTVVWVLVIALLVGVTIWLRFLRSQVATVRSELDAARVVPSPARPAPPPSIPRRDLLVRSLAHLGTSSAVITGTPDRVEVAVLPSLIPATVPALRDLLDEFGFPAYTDARLTRSTAADGAQIAWSRDGDLIVVWTNHQDFGLRLVVEPSRPQ